MSDLEIDPIENVSRGFTCPCCNAQLQFMTSVQIKSVKPTGTFTETDTGVKLNAPTDPLTVEQRAIITALKANGVFASFVEAARNTSNIPLPGNLEKAFFTTMRSLTKAKTPQFAIRLCLPEEDRAGNLELWRCNLVCVVIRDDEVLMFLPNGLVEGNGAGRLEVSETGIQKASYDLNGWVKTRNGYVAGKGLMFSELAGRSKGSFDAALTGSRVPKTLNGLRVNK